MFHAEKARHKDVVRRQERIVGQPIARDPQGGVVIAEDHVARDDRRHVGAQENAVRGIVVCPFETQRTDRDLDGQFLADLADKTRFGRLPVPAFRRGIPRNRRGRAGPRADAAQ